MHTTCMTMHRVREGDERPRTRGECVDSLRPCAFVSCRHHLYLDVSARGRLKFNAPGKAPEDLEESCALDVADRDGVTLDEIARMLNLTREGVRRIEIVASAKMEARLMRAEGARRLPLLSAEQHPP